MEKNVKIICFVGMSGSGKTTAAEYVKDKGVPDIYFGGMIYKAMQEAGVEITPESQQKFREEIREKEGKDFVAKRVIEEAHKLIESGQHRLVFDGLYTWSEYRILKHEFPGEMTMVALTPNKHLRHHRLAHRPNRPFDAKEANERDWSEIENLEKGGPIAIADYFVQNNGSIEDLHAELDEILKEIKFFE
ncbi:MAG: AAA family ATPase [Candidatus Nomurabacteria bacterium]|jgi:dephospho-CoA kinase|nr:AAA family ATPase [Candidatus Nomurabacteria bacterium]